MPTLLASPLNHRDLRDLNKEKEWKGRELEEEKNPNQPTLILLSARIDTVTVCPG